MLEPFFFADFRMLSDNIQRQVLVISNAKIRSQFQRSVFGRKIEKAAGEADDITIRLTSKAMKMTFPLIVPRPDEASPAALLQLFCQYPVLHSALPGVRSWFLVHPLEETACRLPL